MDLQSYAESDATAKNNKITVAGRSKKPWKLRQTCDACSEAKVKCDKGNPRCGRCDRMSYDCVYSPARRFGRPRPSSPPYQEGGQRTRDGGAVTTKANKEYTAPPPSSERSKQAPKRQPSHNEARPDGLPDNADRWTAPASASNTTGNTRSNDAPLSTNMRDGLLSSLEQHSLDIEETRHNPYEYDCVTVAVATLKKLAVTGLEGQSATQATAAADVLADLIPHACRQATRILVCPCSADMDTALLVASLVGAILEGADAALRTLKPAGQALDNEQHTVLALGTLPNISQVVTLFSHRYSVTQGSRPPEALLLLAATLRTTLRTMAEETTNRFLDNGAVPVRMEVVAKIE